MRQFQNVQFRSLRLSVRLTDCYFILTGYNATIVYKDVHDGLPSVRDIT